MLSEVNCKQCDEFLTQGHVCEPAMTEQGSIYQISKMVYEALHPEEDSAEAL